MNGPRINEQHLQRIRGKIHSSDRRDDSLNLAGTVIASFGKQALVESLQGEKHLCHLRSGLEPVVAGDNVGWAVSGEAGVITSLCPRFSKLERLNKLGKLRPFAANIDLMLVVFAPKPEPHPNLLDRYLVAAENANIEAALVLNKSDLITDEGVGSILRRYEHLGYRTLTTGSLDEEISLLEKFISDTTLVIVGQSGVGKSSLVNRLMPDDYAKVGELSETKQKGKHTTTTTQLFQLPGGARLIDSPGVREFRLQHLQINQVALGFRELRPFLGNCKFRDCKHGREPNCALLEAREQGAISLERFESFQEIISDRGAHRAHSDESLS